MKITETLRTSKETMNGEPVFNLFNSRGTFRGYTKSLDFLDVEDGLSRELANFYNLTLLEAELSGNKIEVTYNTQI